MVAVVVTMAIMTVMLGVAVQTATFQRKREKELELVFRGQQFVEGVRLFRARNGRFPQKLEELIKANPRVMRKKWIDPITGKFDWVPVFYGQGGAQVGGTNQGANPGATPAPTPAPTKPPSDDEGDAGGGKGGKEEAPFAAVDAQGPIIGVHSRSRDKAIMVRDGRSRYSDWNFSLEQQQQGQGGRTGQPQPTPRP